MTPFQYLLHYRLEKGAKQLKLTHNNVTEVAMDCGFLQRVISYRCLKINTKLHLNNFNYHINKNANSVINIPDNWNSHFGVDGNYFECYSNLHFVVRSCERV